MFALDDLAGVDDQRAPARRVVETCPQLSPGHPRLEVDSHDRGDRPDVVLEKRNGEHVDRVVAVELIGRDDDTDERGLERRTEGLALVAQPVVGLGTRPRHEVEPVSDVRVGLDHVGLVGDELVWMRGIGLPTGDEAGMERSAREDDRVRRPLGGFVVGAREHERHRMH